MLDTLDLMEGRRSNDLAELSPRSPLPQSSQIMTYFPQALVFFFVCTAIIPSPTLRAQEADVADTLAIPKQEPHTNSLGMAFVPLPRVPVQIAVHEVRVSDFETFMAAANYNREADTLHFEQEADHPAVNINLEDAKAFCAWLTQKELAAGKLNSKQSYRLPTNIEWSAAAGIVAGRGMGLSGSSDQRLENERGFPWGTGWPPPEGAGNFASHEIQGYSDPFRYTSPVGKFKPNALGLYDMAGNVWEWCDEPNRSDKTKATVRGGSWIYFREDFLRSSYRYEVPPALRAPTFGFRCIYEDAEIKAKILLAQKMSQESAIASANDRLRAEDVEGDDVTSARGRFLASRETSGGDELVLNGDAQPPVAGRRFLNSIGMKFQPVVNTTILVGAMEVQVKEFNHFTTLTGAKWKRPTFTQSGSHCAVGMTYDQAVAFCDFLTKKELDLGILKGNQHYRLPTDAEWSLAAQLPESVGQPHELDGGQPGTFPWGREWPPPSFAGNLDGDKIDGFRDRYSYTSPVGRGSANEFGIHDLAGNASEWCAGFFSPGSEKRVARGSSWLDSRKEILYSSARKSFAGSTSKPDLGFRCVLQLR